LCIAFKEDTFGVNSNTMENEMQPISEKDQNTIEINFEGMSYLNGIRKWTKFFSILGFVGVALMVVLALTMGTVIAGLGSVANSQAFPFPTVLVTILYLVFAGLYLYPAISLYKFSTALGLALDSREGSQITKAFKFLNGHFNYVGVLTIVILGLYVVFFLIAIMGILLQ
jgi:hypothetical protein